MKTDDGPYRPSAHELLEMPFFKPHFEELDVTMLKDEIELARTGPPTRSVRQEFACNEHGRWLPEFEYVAHEEAVATASSCCHLPWITEVRPSLTYWRTRRHTFMTLPQVVSTIVARVLPQQWAPEHGALGIGMLAWTQGLECFTAAGVEVCRILKEGKNGKSWFSHHVY
mgnify:CR=1 FL=1